MTDCGIYPLLQCLSVIEEALKDDCLTPATTLSLVQRARRILQPKASKSRKRKRSDKDGGEANSSSSATALQLLCDSELVEKYSMDDYPEVDLIRAPEVMWSPLSAHEPDTL